jgi:hypothetical protein
VKIPVILDTSWEPHHRLARAALWSPLIYSHDGLVCEINAVEIWMKCLFREDPFQYYPHPRLGLPSRHFEMFLYDFTTLTISLQEYKTNKIKEYEFIGIFVWNATQLWRDTRLTVQVSNTALQLIPAASLSLHVSMVFIVTCLISMNVKLYKILNSRPQIMLIINIMQFNYYPTFSCSYDEELNKYTVCPCFSNSSLPRKGFVVEKRAP